MRVPASLIALLVLFAAFPGTSSAQLPLGEPQGTTQAAKDPFDRETPRSTVAGLIKALAERNYLLASHYFASEDDDSARIAEQARALQTSLDAGGTLTPFAELSNDPAGRLNDGLPLDVERVGTLGGEGQTPILLVRSSPESVEGDSAGSQPSIWRVSGETLAALKAQPRDLDATVSPEEEFLVLGAPLRDWGLLAGLLVVTFGAFWLLSWLVLAGLRRLQSDPDASGPFQFLHAALPPLSLFLAVIAFRIWGNDLPVAIVARQTMLRYVGVFAWVALAWFAIRMVDAVAARLTRRLGSHERRQAASAVTLARRAIKLILAAMAFIAILNTIGVDITTGIAALGIGGIALALGAQKTVENLVGSVTVVADRPIQVGDFCRVGDVLGTVEDIGMRSTRIRTNERTVVTIPNGDFAARQIENYSQRDRYLFNPVIGLEYGISAARLRDGIGIIEAVLAEHPHVSEDPRRVKLANFGASSLDIEVFTYITVPDFAESLGIRQELLLAILERLDEAGLPIAFPSRTIYLRPENAAASPQPAEEVEA
ncbi:mechanosensitive ion channel family protein [Erythrobacter sp. NE805]|uniref:mechanosensitive ion channel family protein n=1 Tax=Erythrobacter sp. NE805 TaxID=3389875 RepID=UPI00396AEFD3